MTTMYFKVEHLVIVNLDPATLYIIPNCRFTALYYNLLEYMGGEYLLELTCTWHKTSWRKYSLEDGCVVVHSEQTQHHRPILCHVNPIWYLMFTLQHTSHWLHFQPTCTVVPSFSTQLAKTLHGSTYRTLIIAVHRPQHPLLCVKDKDVGA